MLHASLGGGRRPPDGRRHPVAAPPPAPPPVPALPLVGAAGPPAGDVPELRRLIATSRAVLGDDRWSHALTPVGFALGAGMSGELPEGRGGASPGGGGLPRARRAVGHHDHAREPGRVGRLSRRADRGRPRGGRGPRLVEELDSAVDMADLLRARGDGGLAAGDLDGAHADFEEALRLASPRRRAGAGGGCPPRAGGARPAAGRRAGPAEPGRAGARRVPGRLVHRRRCPVGAPGPAGTDRRGGWRGRDGPRLVPPGGRRAAGVVEASRASRRRSAPSRGWRAGLTTGAARGARTVRGRSAGRGTLRGHDQQDTSGRRRGTAQAVRHDLGPRRARPDRAGRHGVRAAGAERRRQDHGGADPGHAAAPRRRAGPVAGYDVVRQPQRVRARIGLTGQYAAVDEMLSGRQNLVLFGRLHHLSRPARPGGARTSCWSGSASPRRRTARPASTPAACAGGSTWPPA